MNPVVAVVLGALILDEPITHAVLIGGAIIVAAVAIVISVERVRKHPTESAKVHDERSGAGIAQSR